MLILFNVFGQKMSVQRKNNEWLLFVESDTSLRARVYDVVIPSELPKSIYPHFLLICTTKIRQKSMTEWNCCPVISHQN